MKLGKYLFLIVFIFILATIPVFSKQAKGTVATKHPVPMEGQNCISCHEGDQNYVEWEKSGHGTILVKCEVCHGEEKNFVKRPSEKVCRGCHASQFENMPVANVTCISCHPAHSFKLKGHK
ncbi:MAG: NapC/NirT family cytochrome c [Calditerrivibrio sp.]|nr:NapC/NirT family cytochrome c [Calditerrivibrio sp.]